MRVLTSERVVVERWGAILGAARKLKLDLDGEEMIRMPSLFLKARSFCKSAGDVLCPSCIQNYPISRRSCTSHLGYVPTGI